MLKISIKKLSPEAIIPKKSTSGAIAYDVFTPRDFIVKPGRQILPLEMAIELPYGYEAKIEPRSGYSSKGMVGEMNDYIVRLDADVIPGKVDSDYRGGIGVIINSHESECFIIPAKTPIAQLTLYRGEDADFVETDTLTPTERGEGGFGHTSDNNYES